MELGLFCSRGSSLRSCCLIMHLVDGRSGVGALSSIRHCRSSKPPTPPRKAANNHGIHRLSTTCALSRQYFDTYIFVVYGKFVHTFKGDKRATYCTNWCRAPIGRANYESISNGINTKDHEGAYPFYIYSSSNKPFYLACVEGGILSHLYLFSWCFLGTSVFQKKKNIFREETPIVTRCAEEFSIFVQN